MIAKHKRSRWALNPLARLWNYVLHATVGYGYRAMVGVGAAVFAKARAEGAFSPAKPEGQITEFNAVLYAADSLRD
jgi:hypothetical protein